MGSPVIVVSTDLLAAVAKWATDDRAHTFGVVAFRDGEMIAGDNTRLVRVPLETHGLSFGIVRAHLLAAVAAQSVLARDGIEPQVDHDVALNGAGEVVLADGPYGARGIEISALDETRIVLTLGAVALRVPRMDISTFPTRAQIDGVSKAATAEGAPDGHVVDPLFMVAVNEVNLASGCYRNGARFVAWSRLKDGQPDGPLLLENRAGVRFVLMPMKPWTETTS